MTKRVTSLLRVILISVLVCGLMPCGSAVAQTAPPNTLDLGVIIARLSHQASYRVAMDLEPVEFNMTVIRVPDGVYLDQIKPRHIHYAQIGARSWMGLGTETGPQWVPNDNDDASLAESRDESKSILQAMVNGGFAMLRLIFSAGQEAILVRTDHSVMGVPCHEYTWTTTDEANGVVCLDTEQQLPVQAIITGPDFTYTMTFSRYNDPANAFQPPLQEAPNTLYMTDTWMALNSLSSYQWTLAEEGITASGSIVDTVQQGIYIQENLTWETYMWSDGDTAHPPNSGVLEQQKTRWMMSQEDGSWQQIPPFLNTPDTDDLFEFFVPHRLWRETYAVVSDTPLTRVENGRRQVGNAECDDYQVDLNYAPDDEGPEGTMSLLICITPDSGVPLYLERYAERGAASLSSTWVLHAANDAQNVIEVPVVE
ncbi:MAG: hypothetical protein K8S97_01860 [Anaerolineae bacterium]|nr:hypothetical protein [Anaerolineae bacterium]